MLSVNANKEHTQIRMKSSEHSVQTMLRFNTFRLQPPSLCCNPLVIFTAINKLTNPVKASLPPEPRRTLMRLHFCSEIQ